MSRHTKDDEAMHRRPDNVGQSGRWRKGDASPEAAGADRYGQEERWHSGEHPGGTPPTEAGEHEPRADRPETTYPGHAEEGEEHGDDKARYRDKAYADAGGSTGGNQPKHPGQRWKDEGGAGHGENYGTRRDDEKNAGTPKKR
jgi:hypothetical protein